MIETSEQTMLKAISIIGKARAMKRSSRPLAIIELIRGVSLMNKAISMDPNNIENRKYRFRHLLGITVNSPKKYLEEIQDDISFFKNKFDELSFDDKSYYLSTLGEFEIYMGNHVEGLRILNDVIDNYKNTSMYDYTKVYLTTIEEDL